MDIALAVEQLLGPGVAYGSAATYDDLVRTWEDDRFPVPTLVELESAWATYQPPLPPYVSNLAFKESLIEHGILPEQVEAHLAAIPDPATRALVQLRWQQSRIALGDPVLAAQAAAFGLTDEQLAAIYRRAVAIEQERGL